ncbi:MAG TPA: hypothetical protein VIL90_07890 [Puia sp.]|jgi:hypothetical protein
MDRKYIICFVVLSSFSSCLTPRQGYFLSPGNANSDPYHTIPLHTDSNKTAIYVNAGYSIGSANDRGFDQVSVGQLSIHRSNNFGIFQAYYGVNLSLGACNVAEFYNSHYRYVGGWFSSVPVPYDTIYHIPGKGEFFGSYGIMGGINLVFDGHRGEWRAIGIETAIQNEFGNYLEFRKSLPDTAANIIFTKNLQQRWDYIQI